MCSLAAEYLVSDQRLELPVDGSNSRLACQPKGFDFVSQALVPKPHVAIIPPRLIHTRPSSIYKKKKKEGTQTAVCNFRDFFEGKLGPFFPILSSKSHKVQEKK